MQKYNVVYFDMDGVLTDFNRTVFEMTGKNINQLKSEGLYEEFMYDNAPRNFFVDLEPSPHLTQMMTLMYKLKSSGVGVEILTSYGPWCDDFGVTAHRCKVQWLRDHLKSPEKYIDKFNGVPLCHQKGFYGNPTSYLIDDQPENCDAFTANGGDSAVYSIIAHNKCYSKICSDLGISL